MEDDNRPEPESHPMTSPENLSTNKGKEVFAVKAQVHYSYETKVKSVNKAEKERGIKVGNKVYVTYISNTSQGRVKKKKKKCELFHNFEILNFGKFQVSKWAFGMKRLFKVSFKN